MRDTPKQTKSTMETISDLCRIYATARERLAETGEAIREERRAAVRRRMAILKRRISEVSVARDALRDAIEHAPDLFGKPRTRAIEGIKIGYRKMPGRIEIADESRSIDRLRQLFPERLVTLVQVKETLRRPALRGLDARDLAAIGVSIIDVADEVVIATAGNDLDRLIDALLADGEEKDK